MAVLGATSLTGCNSIPSFLGTGSKMVFRMATCPVSWTKDTTVNEGSLRVVNGSVSPGGGITWSQCFATRPFSASIQDGFDGCSVQQATTNLTLNQVNYAQTQTSSNAVSLAQMQPHLHQAIAGTPGTTSLRSVSSQGVASSLSSVSTGSYGQGGQHSHSVPSTQHSHPGPANRQHSHTISGSHGHTGNSGSVDFNLTYVDMIIAQKDA